MTGFFRTGDGGLRSTGFGLVATRFVRLSAASSNALRFASRRAEHAIEDASSRAAHVLGVGGGVARPDGGGHGGGPP